MTLPEFRAWLEGYENSFPTQLDIITERMIPVPTPEQWAEVKRRLEGVGASKPGPMIYDNMAKAYVPQWGDALGAPAIPIDPHHRKRAT